MVAQSLALDMASRPPLQLSVRCQSKDKDGNANPFCLQGVGLAPPLGFQFVPNLAANPCSMAVPTLNATGSQFARAFPWLRDVASPAVAWVEGAMGIPASDIASATSDAFQVRVRARACTGRGSWMRTGASLRQTRVHALLRHARLRALVLQLMYFNDLASDLLIDTGAVWEHAGAPMAGTSDASASKPYHRCGIAACEPRAPQLVWMQSSMLLVVTQECCRDIAAEVQALRNASAQQLDAAARARFPGRARTDLLRDNADAGNFAAAAQAAAAAQPETVTTLPIPLCPLPATAASAGLVADPPTAGLGASSRRHCCCGRWRVFAGCHRHLASSACLPDP